MQHTPHASHLNGALWGVFLLNDLDLNKSVGPSLKYDKPALTIDQQIALLTLRGMSFQDHALAVKSLQNLNYYRLSGYWLRYQQDRQTHTFSAGTTFEQVILDYVFDRDLRLLVLDAVEQIETSIRTRWAHMLGLQYGAHAHLDSTLFRQNHPKWNHSTAITVIAEAVKQSREDFIQHLRKTYDEALPPVWAVVEVLSLGQISRLYANLRYKHDRQIIAADYGVDESLMISFLHHVSVIRNLCAHHSRLWNRNLSLKMQLPRKRPVDLVSSFNYQRRGDVYNTLTLLGWMVSRIDPLNTWQKKVKDHVRGHAPACAEMGFPLNFENSPVWGRL